MHLSAKKVEETSCKSSKRNEDAVMTKNVEDNLPATSELILKECRQSLTTNSVNSTYYEDDSEQNPQPLVANNVNEYDDDKENDSSVRIVNSSTTNSESEGLQFETNDNIPQKEMTTARKNIQNHGKQAAKVKRTTNPKPFRLRTNERGILKEANLEKKMKLEAQKETASVLRHGDEKHHNTIIEKKHQLNLEGQKTQPNQTRTRVRYVKSRYARVLPKCHKAEGKKTKESQNNIVKTASSRQNLKGNGLFKEGKYELAKAKYEKVPREYNHVNPQDGKEGKIFLNLGIANQCDQERKAFNKKSMGESLILIPIKCRTTHDSGYIFCITSWMSNQKSLDLRTYHKAINN